MYFSLFLVHLCSCLQFQVKMFLFVIENKPKNFIFFYVQITDLLQGVKYINSMNIWLEYFMCVPFHSRYSYKNSQKITREKIIFYLVLFWLYMPCQVALVVKKLPANAGDIRDMASILGLGRSPGGGPDNPLQYSCLGNLMDRGA